MNHLTLPIFEMTKIEATSMAVSIVVIAFLTIGFGVLFYLYYHYYKKCVKGGLEDSYLKEEIIKENPSYFKNVEKVIYDDSLSLEEKYESVPTIQEHVKDVLMRKNGLKFLANTVLVLVYLACLSVLIFAATSRASGEVFPFGNTSCVVIRTGSMEEVNPSNGYIKEHNLTDQIETMALIGLDKVENEEAMEQYKIYAIEGDNRILVHRLITIRENEEGDTVYTFRGDANSASFNEEIDVPFEQIIGVYNGFQNVGLGMTVAYLQSDIGIIAVCFGLILIGCYDIFEIILGKRIEERKQLLYPIIDGETKHHILESSSLHSRLELQEKKPHIEEPKE